MTKDQWLDLPYEQRRDLMRNVLQELVDIEKEEKVRAKVKNKENHARKMAGIRHQQVLENQVVEMIAWEKEEKFN